MKPGMHILKLSPANLQLHVAHGTRLQDILFAHGVEFPCGGRGRCKGCRVKVLAGDLPATEQEKKLLTAGEIAGGWRLACQHFVRGDLELELAQWEMPVLCDHTTFKFPPREGLGVAIDLGTTTIAAQLLDLQTGSVLAVETALNQQGRHGADIMSRIDFAMRGGQLELERLIRKQVAQIVARLLRTHARRHPADGVKRDPGPGLSRVVIVGNTVMHHLFCGIPVRPLAAAPFEPEQPGRMKFTAAALGWDLPGETVVEFLPCIGGFVGSDILAGVVATGLHQGRQLSALVDLGTNGEVVVGNCDRLLCTSTAAGPAFEGARISMGMRAATGAISEVRVQDGSIVCRVIGGGAPRGLCGSGLVDAVAAGLELGWIAPDGRMTVGGAMLLQGDVSLLAADVRELQLAKGAIATGLRILTLRLGASLDDIRTLHLAGAFGNYVSRVSARRIGLIRLPIERIVPAGNTALLGAKRALFENAADWDAIARRIEHVPLNGDPAFHDIYTEEMRFPD